ncbi:MAG TPA: AMP-binding protein [Acidimicrobiales bacterium]|nr:AMP-binding protein [Acidimicrobiales bacterium]
MPVLVALDAVPGSAFVDELRRIWDGGDAVLPVDPRLPAPARARLLQALRPGEEVEAGDALVVATSGTTGAPRGVVLTHAAVQAAAEAVHRRLSVDPATDRWLACLPLSHVGGLMVVVRSVLTGTPLTFATDIGGDVGGATSPAEPAATLVSVVPTLLDRMGTAGFRVVLLGGAADSGLRAGNVVRTYGMTETAGGVVYDGEPLDCIEVRADATGRLQVRGPTLLRSYRDGTDPKGPDGWLSTGDVGEMVEGRLVVHGRADDLIVTGGENVWPGPVEEILLTHPAVADVAVVGRPDEEWGERVVAVVVPQDPVAPPALAGLRSLVKERQPAYTAPRELVLVDALPRTAGGKLRRSALRSLLP